jgi:lipooligosaccharide transport system permease protein
MNLSYRIYYVWKRNLVAYKRFVIPTVLVSLGEPFFYLIAMGLGLGAYMGLFGGRSYLQFLAPGLIVASGMMASTFECLYDSYVRMVIEEIYSSLIVTPILAEDIVAGDIAWGAFRGIISGFLMFVVAAILGAVPVNPIVIIQIFFLLLISGLMFSSMAMIVTAFAPNFDFFTYYTELLISPMFFFSGVFFPLDKMPYWIRVAAEFLPLTHAARFSRAFFDGRYNWALFYDLLYILLLLFVVFRLAVFFMKRRLIK